MKRYFLLIFFFFLISISTNGQRWIPSQDGIQIRSGWGDGYFYTKDKSLCFYASIGYSSYMRNAKKWALDFEYFHKDYCYESENIPSAQFLLEYSMYKTLWKTRSSDFYVNVGLGVHTGYETVNWNEKTMLDGASIINDDRFLYGAGMVIEFETFVCDKVILQLHCKERINNSSISKFHFLVGMGVKFLIN